MPSFLLQDLDPLRVAAGLVDLDGTVLLHTQRPWHGTGGSVLLFDPVWALTARAGRIESRGPVPVVQRPAATIGGRIEQLRSLAPDDDGPGMPLLAGYLGYDLGAGRFGCAHPEATPFDLPDAWIGCYDTALVFGPDRPPRLLLRDLSAYGGRSTAGREESVIHRLREAAARVDRPGGRSGPVEFPGPAWHATAVQRIREHLHAGDTYQVNLTGLATAETSVPPFEHFLRHSLENPVPFGACLRICGVTITSHSPERLLRIEGDRAETAPIKGTIARSEGSRHLLRASEKDRAEHLMIVDLCRNDLGRRAVTGSVHVTELLEPLALRGIDHLVSRIEARVRPGGRGGLLDSLFPGGSVTGAPKRRAMEIITEVEKSRRGPYTGSIGYVTPGGDADFSIAIRTAVWSEERVWFGCGGGIVVDSEPESEYAEARLKAESFFATLERCSGR